MSTQFITVKFWVIVFLLAGVAASSVQSQTATNLLYTTSAGMSLSVPAPGVLGNFNSNGTSAVLVSGAANGLLVLNPNGSFTYTPTNSFTGVDTFTYEATNGVSTSSVAVVAIEVTPPGALFLDGFTHSSLWPWVPELGTWGITNGVLTGACPTNSYAHLVLTNIWTDYLVQAQIRFSDSNGWGGGIGGRITDPVAGTRYDAWIYPEGSPEFGPQSVRLEKYASWTDQTWQTMGEAPVASVGTNWHTLGLAFQGTNLFVYYDGTQVISTYDNRSYNGGPYAAGGICANLWDEPPVNYAMSVSNVSVVPLVANASYSVAAGTTLSVASPGPLGNDIPVYGGSLTMTVLTNPANGVLMVATNNGSFTYTPTNNFTGTDGFVYEAINGSNVLGTATVTITVNTVSAALQITSIGLSNGTVTITWNSVPGASYDLLYKNTLTNGSSWTALTTNILANGASTSAIDTPVGAMRYYLVEMVP